ncbi:unnamed protein product, partial [Nesidiocoris tenuis]
MDTSVELAVFHFCNRYALMRVKKVPYKRVIYSPDRGLLMEMNSQVFFKTRCTISLALNKPRNRRTIRKNERNLTVPALKSSRSASAFEKTLFRLMGGENSYESRRRICSHGRCHTEKKKKPVLSNNEDTNLHEIAMVDVHVEIAELQRLSGRRCGKFSVLDQDFEDVVDYLRFDVEHRIVVLQVQLVLFVLHNEKTEKGCSICNFSEIDQDMNSLDKTVALDKMIMRKGLL